MRAAVAGDRARSGGGRRDRRDRRRSRAASPGCPANPTVASAIAPTSVPVPERRFARSTVSCTVRDSYAASGRSQGWPSSDATESQGARTVATNAATESEGFTIERSTGSPSLVDVDGRIAPHDLRRRRRGRDHAVERNRERGVARGEQNRRVHGAQESRDVEGRHADRLHAVRSEREGVRHDHEAAVVRLRAHEDGVGSAVAHDERRGRARAGRRDERRDGRRLGHEQERGPEDVAHRHAQRRETTGRPNRRTLRPAPGKRSRRVPR